MPTYIILANYTDQGARDIKNAPQKAKDALKFLEASGGKVLGAYTTMGQYDRTVVTEAPNDEVVMAFLLKLAERGNVRTTTLKAFNAEQITEITKRI